MSDLLVLGLAAAEVPGWFTAALFAGAAAGGWALWRAER
jgi:hypothetical protein